MLKKIMGRGRRRADLRTAERFSVFQRSYFSVDGPGTSGTKECDIHDLSVTGLRFHSNVRLDPGTRVVILLHHRGNPVRLQAVIRWHHHFTEHKYGASLIFPDRKWPEVMQQLISSN